MKPSTLYVVRHGLAASIGAGVATDADRPLTEEGRGVLQLSGRALRGMGITVGCLASSPLVRADETAHILRTELHFPGAVVTSPLLLPEAPVDQTIAWLREIPEDPILVVSHLPLLPRLASTCLAGGGTFVGFHAGGVASLVFSGGAVSRGKGRLEWLLTPEQLLKCAGASPEDEEP